MSSETISTVPENQDLFRNSYPPPHRISEALNWLRGNGPYPYPSSIHFHLTLKCTAHCTHCKQWTWPAHAVLDLEELGRLFRIFVKWGVESITLGGGNPLLHPHIIPVLQLARQSNLKIGIISEGIDLSDELAKSIAERAGWIRFSLDGPDAVIHDKIRNTPGLFERVTHCVHRLKSLESRVEVGLNCVVQQRNVYHLSRMIALAEELRVDVLTFKVPHGDDRGKHFLLSSQEWAFFSNWVSTNCKRSTSVRTNLTALDQLIGPVIREADVVVGRPVRSFYTENQVHCFTPLFFLTCDSQGNMYPCDYLQADTRLWGPYQDMRQEFSLGNVLREEQVVIDRLEGLMRRRVHGLPASGYDECGCCTRFCQLNSHMDDINSKIGPNYVDGDQLDMVVRHLSLKRDFFG